MAGSGGVAGVLGRLLGFWGVTGILGWVAGVLGVSGNAGASLFLGGLWGSGGSQGVCPPAKPSSLPGNLVQFRRPQLVVPPESQPPHIALRGGTLVLECIAEGL